MTQIDTDRPTRCLVAFPRSSTYSSVTSAFSVFLCPAFFQRQHESDFWRNCGKIVFFSVFLSVSVPPWWVLVAALLRCVLCGKFFLRRKMRLRMIPQSHLFVLSCYLRRLRLF